MSILETLAGRYGLTVADIIGNDAVAAVCYADCMNKMEFLREFCKLHKEDDIKAARETEMRYSVSAFIEWFSEKTIKDIEILRLQII